MDMSVNTKEMIAYVLAEATGSQHAMFGAGTGFGKSCGAANPGEPLS